MATIGDLYRLRDRANALYDGAVALETSARIKRLSDPETHRHLKQATQALADLQGDFDTAIETADPFGDAAPSKRCSCRRK